MNKYKDSQPDLVELFKAAYVDDIITGANNEAAAHELFVKAKEILMEKGFNLRKFYSNSSMLQGIINGQPQSLENRKGSFDSPTFDNAESTQSRERKVLGVCWDPATDQLVMCLEEVAQATLHIIPSCVCVYNYKKKPTKREIVSLVGRIFDPLRILSPVVILLKIFLQEMCVAKIAWDKELFGHLLEKWNQLASTLRQTNIFRIPRCYLNGVDDQILLYRLCGFCDASFKAYVAVVYLLIETPLGRHVRITASKTRVSPLKTLTIPRLELLVALLLRGGKTTCAEYQLAGHGQKWMLLLPEPVVERRDHMYIKSSQPATAPGGKTSAGLERGSEMKLGISLTGARAADWAAL